MAQPGRGRSISIIGILTLALLFFSPSVLAANAVLGIDVGTEYLKAALVKPGIPLEIVLTKDSKRKETSALAFKTSSHGPQSDGQLPERLYGGDALALGARIPGDVFPNLKHLLGVSQRGGEETLETYKQRYPALDIYQHANGTVGFKSKSFVDKAAAYSVEELLSMELKTIRSNAEAMAGSRVKDAVITVPAFYTAAERRSLELAVELAGMKVLGLVSDGMAVGLNYAMTRTFANVDEGGNAEYHLVYDMGAGSTTATVLRMQGRRVKDVGRFNKTIQEVTTLGLGWDRTLGGDALNDLIVNDMIENFVESSAAKKLGIEATTIKTHGRTMAKLWKDSERLRQILSANSVASSFFESFYEDIDFKYKISRADFEALATSFGARVQNPINDALASAGMTLDDISSVILHGGVVRTPFVQASLEAIAGGPAKLKSNVNADEAAVFGAAFKAAGLNPSFRVKEIQANDAAVYPVTVHWQASGKDRTQQIFVATSQAGAVKQMPFNRVTEDFTFNFGQKVPIVEAGQTEESELPVLEVKSTNLTASVAKLVSEHNCAKENITTIFSIRIDPATGYPEVTKGSVSCESTTVEKPSMMDGVKGMLGFGKKDQKPSSDEDEGELLEPLEDSTSSSSSSSTASSASSSATGKSKKGKGKDAKSKDAKGKDAKGKDKDVPAAPVKKTYTINIAIESEKLGLAQPIGHELQRIKEGLAAFDKSDKGRRLREELFNGLEAFTYRVRDMLTDTGFKSVSTAEQRVAIEKLLTATSEWLGEEGVQASMEIIKAKLQDLKALVDPVTRRKEETTKRPEAVAQLQKALKAATVLKDSIAEKIASAASAASVAAADAASTATEAVLSATKTFPSATEAAAEAVSSATDAAADAASSVSSFASSVTSSLGPDSTDTAEDFKFGSDGESSYDADATFSSLMAKYSTFTDPSAFTDADLTRLTSAYEAASSWLTEQMTAQEALRDSEEPALLSSEVEAQSAKLKKVVDELERKNLLARSKASAWSSSSSSSKKAKKSKTSASASTLTVSLDPEVTEDAKQESNDAWDKDEL